MFRLVERLDGLPRHIAMHPCGVLLSDATLLDRTPVEASFAGFPMSQFDKDDVEDLGLLKLDVLGIRMQSSMAHAVAEIQRVDGVEIDLDDEAQVPLRRRGDLRADQPGPDPRGLPDRVAGPARAGRQVRDRDVRRHHHRHLAVPARAGQERHGHAVPRRQAGLERADLPPRRPAADPRADPGRGGLPRAGDRDDRPVRRRQPGRGRREAAGARRPRGDGRDEAVVLPARARPRLLRCRWSRRSGRCSRRSRRSASARRTPRRSRSRPTSPPGSRRTGRRTSSPACSPTTRGCTPSG